MIVRPVEMRMAVVIGGILLAFLLFIARAHRLQITLQEEHLARASWGVESVSRIEAPRGEIRDRNGELLAGTSQAFTLAIDPRFLITEEVEHLNTVRAALARVEGFDVAEFDTWLAMPQHEVPRYRVLRRMMSPQEVREVLGPIESLRLRSVIREEGHQRRYPNGVIGGRTIGFVDAHGRHGVAGAELAFDELLVGRDVFVRYERDSARQPYLLGELPDVASASGATVELTLDRRLQAASESALEHVVSQYSAQRGVVVVSRVATGELLALASWPPFDPNSNVESEGWAEPAVAHVYEPGSTAKIFTFAAALADGVIDYDSVIDCEGGAVSIGRFRVRDRYCRGSITAWETVRDSSNIGALRMGMRMTQETHRSALAAFGFGQRSGVELPSEARGSLAPTTPPWPNSQHATISYGYGFSATPLQLNMATAAIANGGVRMRPTIIRRVTLANGVVTREFAPQVAAVAVAPEVAAQVARAMATVVSTEGTARLATVPGFDSAGKTGTARMLDGGRYAENQYLALFTGFVPVDDPQFAITVIIERPDPALGYYGGLVAAPVFAEVGRRAVALDGLVPDESPGEPVGVAARATAIEHEAFADAIPTAEELEPTVSLGASDTREVPHLIGLRASEALTRAAAAGVEVRVEGVGVVVEQRPPPGSPASPNTRVTLTLGGR